MVRSPWQVAANELQQLRGSGGVPFTEFVDALLRAEAAVTGATRPEDVITNIRVNISDGGVDSEVRIALRGRPGFETPTCWQYKATDFADVTDAKLEKEASGDRVVARITEGYAYCVCVCDDSTAEKKAERQRTLDEARMRINPSAPAARFLGSSELAAWANRFPSVVVRFFRPALTNALTYESWREKERSDLPKYVELSERTQVAKEIAARASFTTVGPAVTTLAGPTGTGKTRLVLEALAAVGPLVLYTLDGPHVVNLLTAMVNDSDTTCVLVVDDCSLVTRKAMSALLSGVAQRIRAVAIADSSEEAPSVSLTLTALTDASTTKILEANFPEVSSSHQRGVAHLAGGVLRVAATLAREYRVAGSSFLDSAVRTEDDCVRVLIRSDEDMRVLEAIGLFPRVGYAGSVAPQLASVAQLFSLDPADVSARCRRLASAPGLITIGQRYLAVRPPLYCGAFVARAWRRWVEGDATGFLERIPSELRPGLLEQLAAHGTAQIRDQVAEWGTAWARQLRPNQLCSAATMAVLLPLVEVHPRRLGTSLCALIRRATLEELRAPCEEIRRWPTRLHILWCLEKLLSRRDCHAQAESALFRYALAEPEGDRSNLSSAASKWASSFRLFLSGTDTPFAERFALLKQHWTEGASARALVLRALDLVLDPHAWKVEGAPLVAGQLRAVDWQPRTYTEWGDCLRATLGLLAEARRSPDEGAEATRILLRHARGMLSTGLVQELKDAFSASDMEEAVSVRVLECISEFLDFDCTREGEERPQAEIIERAIAWKGELERSDLGHRLAAFLGATSLARQLDDKPAWLADLAALGRELFADRAELARRLPWFASLDRGGEGLFVMGEAIGVQDSTGELLDACLLAATTAANPLFFRGYLLRLAEHPGLADRILPSLDRMESESPAVALDLCGVLGKFSDPAARAVRLVREKRLPPDVLTHVFSLRLSVPLLVEAMELILDVPADDQEQAVSKVLHFLGSLTYGDASVLSDPTVTALSWRVLDMALDKGAGAGAFYWERLASHLAEREPDRGVDLCCRAMVEGDFSIQEHAMPIVATWAQKDPKRLLDALGPRLLDKQRGRGFLFGRKRQILSAIPFELLSRWVEVHGVGAARILAPHLAPPYVGSDGVPVVPPLTEYVLETFGADQDVFESFCAGVHNGQLYSGDVAAQHDNEGRTADRFLGHRVPRIHEWAEYEVGAARRSAQWTRSYEEELDF